MFLFTQTKLQSPLCAGLWWVSSRKRALDVLYLVSGQSLIHYAHKMVSVT